MATWKETEVQFVLKRWTNTDDNVYDVYENSDRIFDANFMDMPGQDALDALDNENSNGCDANRTGRLYKVTVKKTITIDETDYIDSSTQIMCWPGPDDAEQARRDKFETSDVIYDEEEM